MVALGSGWMFLAVIVLVVMCVVGLIKKKQALATTAATFLSLLFVITVGYVYITNDISLTSLEGLIEGTRLYFSWVTAAAKNVIDVTSYAIHLDWVPN